MPIKLENQTEKLYWKKKKKSLRIPWRFPTDIIEFYISQTEYLLYLPTVLKCNVIYYVTIICISFNN